MRILAFLLFFVAFFSFTTILAANKITEFDCDEPFINFKVKCRIREECGGGFFVVYGRQVGLILVRKISKVSKEVEFLPNREGRVKTYYVCFNPIKIRSAVYEVKSTKIVEGSLSTPLSILTQNEEKNFIVKNLPADKCYWIRSTSRDGNYMIEINIYENEEPRCVSGYISTERIVTKEFVNIENKCICNQDVLLMRSDKGIEIRVGT